jgi:hypothetical protein
VHAVEAAAVERVVDRVFGHPFDTVRDLVWFPGGPGGRCPLCGPECQHAWGLR